MEVSAFFHPFNKRYFLNDNSHFDRTILFAPAVIIIIPRIHLIAYCSFSPTDVWLRQRFGQNHDHSFPPCCQLFLVSDILQSNSSLCWTSLVTRGLPSILFEDESGLLDLLSYPKCPVDKNHCKNNKYFFHNSVQSLGLLATK